MTHSPSRHEIWKMFDTISPTYDRVNRVMTYGFDGYWRKKMATLLPSFPSIRLLDVATGTGDQLITLMEHAPHIKEAIGTDLAESMLEIARRKLIQKPYAERVSIQNADALALPFADESFECVTISFGIRNVTDVVGCLKEMNRVLKKGGRALILEATLPTHSLIRAGYLTYLRHILPRIGGWISQNRQAYSYLNQTIETFPAGQSFCDLMIQAGFTKGLAHPLTLGTVTIYQGEKG
jgi:demethylmenaquinone methyltransferase / 2-methoxy-6-polyprenyl-1,4-benzoquinol methylase